MKRADTTTATQSFDTLQTKPLILVTNDDGIDSPGLWLMVEDLITWADVWVVAPHKEQSAASLSVTVREALTIYKQSDRIVDNAWSVSGTPADCVKTALSILMKRPPDIVVSGINRGSNAGKNVLYSGTVGGAIEASLRGLQAIAFSSYSMTSPSFEHYAPLTSKIVRYILDNRTENGIVLNVNFPCPIVVSSMSLTPSNIETPILGVKMVAQGKEYILESPLYLQASRADDDHHGTHFHMGFQLVDKEKNDVTTDIYWLDRGYATCVPVFIEDLTHRKYLESQKEAFEDIFS